MNFGDITFSSEKWQNIYESFGIKRKNGYISTAERNKARKRNRKKNK